MLLGNLNIQISGKVARNNGTVISTLFASCRHWFPAFAWVPEGGNTNMPFINALRFLCPTSVWPRLWRWGEATVVEKSRKDTKGEPDHVRRVMIQAGDCRFVCSRVGSTCSRWRETRSPWPCPCLVSIMAAFCRTLFHISTPSFLLRQGTDFRVMCVSCLWSQYPQSHTGCSPIITTKRIL